MELIKRSYDIEVRSNEGNIEGYGSVFYDGTNGTEFNLYDNIFERIDPKAFDGLLGDCVALFNHDANQVLGRTPATLKLTVDTRGLKYTIQPPETTLGKDLVKSIARGDIRGSSFGAIIEKSVWSKEGTKEIRTITRFSRLLDVSPVTYPAYRGTKATMRSEEINQIEIERNDFYKRIETEIRISRLKNLN